MYPERLIYTNARILLQDQQTDGRQIRCDANKYIPALDYWGNYRHSLRIVSDEVPLSSEQSIPLSVLQGYVSSMAAFIATQGI
jgi:hypothetical protein